MAKRKQAPVTFPQIKALALALPGTEEGTSYGTPAFKVGGKLFARLHQDGTSLVVKIDPGERELWLKAEPRTFFITDHYRDYPWILVNIATVELDDLGDLLEEAWRLSAPKRLLAERDEEPT